MTFFVYLFFLITAGICATKKKLLYILIYYLLIIFFSFRENIGGDWDNYNQNYNWILGLGDQGFFSYEVFKHDIGFIILHYISLTTTGDSKLTFVLAFLFLGFGYRYFCQKLKFSPWIAIGFSPLVFVFLGFGFVKQSISVSFLMISIGYFFQNRKSIYLNSAMILPGGKTLTNCALAGCSILFHKSTAIALAPIAIGFNMLVKTVLILCFFALFPIFAPKLIHFFLEPFAVSDGVFLRVPLFLLLGVVTLFQGINAKHSNTFRSFLAFYSLLFLFLGVFSPMFSAFIDRIFYSLIPIAMLIAKYIRSRRSRFLVELFVFGYGITSFISWYLIGYYSVYWTPISVSV